MIVQSLRHPDARAAKRPFRALEPAEPFLRAALVGARRRGGNPHLQRDRVRLAQRLAAGMTKAEAAQVEGRDEAAVDALLAQEGFRELVESYKALAAEPEAEQTERLVRLARLARLAIENALLDWDAGAAYFVLREHARGRDPARTVAAGVVASARRAAAAAAAGAALDPADPPLAAPSARPRARDPLDALVHRRTAALRRAVAEEQAILRHAVATPWPTPPAVGAVATATAARRAIEAKSAAGAAPPSPLRRLARRLATEASHLWPGPPGPPAAPPSPPPAALPRRPRAP